MFGSNVTRESFVIVFDAFITAAHAVVTCHQSVRQFLGDIAYKRFRLYWSHRLEFVENNFTVS